MAPLLSLLKGVPHEDSSEILVAETDEQVVVANEEKDARAVILERCEATRGGFDLMNVDVEAFEQGVGALADEVVEQPVETVLDCGRDRLETRELSCILFANNTSW